jgi:hypothetical protein
MLRCSTWDWTSRSYLFGMQSASGIWLPVCVFPVQGSHRKSGQTDQSQQRGMPVLPAAKTLQLTEGVILILQSHVEED